MKMTLMKPWCVVATGVLLGFSISGYATSKPQPVRTAFTVAQAAAKGNSSKAQSSLPRPDHVVIVIEENHSYRQAIGSAKTPYLNALAKQGANFTASYGVTHPSEPNYLALFSGSTQGVRDDSCPHSFSGKNLASELIARKLSFSGYSESMPSVGYKKCGAGGGSYGRKHNPWVNFTNVPDKSNQPWTSFPADYSKLPTVSIVVPNMNNDMHDGSIQFGDAWLKKSLAAYLKWAKTHNSLLIVTWDEDDGRHRNRIPTLFVGPMVRAGHTSQKINHYNVLRTLEEMYSLPRLGKSAQAAPIAGIWISK